MSETLLTVQADWGDVFATTTSETSAAASIWVNCRRPSVALRSATLADFRHRRERHGVELHVEDETNSWHVFQRGTPLIASEARRATAVSAIDAAGELVAIGRDDGSVQIHSASSGELLRTSEAAHVGDVTRARFFPSGMVLLTCGIDGRAQIIDASDGEVAATLRGHAGAVFGSAMIERGRTLVTCGRDGTIRHWDVSSQSVLRSFVVSSPSVPLRDCCVDAASQVVWAVSDAGAVHCVDLRSDSSRDAAAAVLSTSVSSQPLRACVRRGATLWCGDESGVVRAVDARQPDKVLRELHRDLFVGQVTSLLAGADAAAGDNALFVGTSTGLALEYSAESGIRQRSFTGIDSESVLLAFNAERLFAVSMRADSDVLQFERQVTQV